MLNKSSMNKKVVPIDPGKNDLINTMKKENGKYIHFRYTQGQRNCDTKKRKYNKIRELLSQGEIKNIESELINFNSKSSSFQEFKNYVKVKISINRQLYQYYSNPLYRKLNWNTYINTKKK